MSSSPALRSIYTAGDHALVTASGRKIKDRARLAQVTGASLSYRMRSDKQVKIKKLTREQIENRQQQKQT